MSEHEIGIYLLSLRVAIFATLLSIPFGLVVGWILARSQGRVKMILDLLVSLPLVLPPIVVGFALLYVLGPNGPLGGMLRWLHLEIVFTWIAASLAAAVVSWPLMVRSIEVALTGVDRRLEGVSQTLGANQLRTFIKITLPLSKRGLIAGVLLAFTRALGEFGATIVVAGNIPGKTQTMPLAIFTFLQTGEETAAIHVILVSIGFAVISLVGYHYLIRRRGWL